MYKVINYGEKISGEEIAYDAQQSFANEHDVIKAVCCFVNISVNVKFVFILNINCPTS